MADEAAFLWERYLVAMAVVAVLQYGKSAMSPTLSVRAVPRGGGRSSAILAAALPEGN